MQEDHTHVPVRLQRISVVGLLGFFDHTVELPEAWEFTIVHGPNGVGKTKLLELTAAAMALNASSVLRIPFRSATFTFNDGSILELLREDRQEALPLDPEFIDQPSEITFRLYHHSQTVPFAWTVRIDLTQEITPSIRQRIERTLPVDRIAPEAWLDRRTGEQMTFLELAERYLDDFPVSIHPVGPIPPQLSSFLNPFHVHLIETQRLVRSTNDRQRKGSSERATVLAFAEDLTQRIGSALAENSRRSQNLDRTFPSRVLALSSGHALGRSLRRTCSYGSLPICRALV